MSGIIKSIGLAVDDDGLTVLRAIVDYHHGAEPAVKFHDVWRQTPVDIVLASETKGEPTFDLDHLRNKTAEKDAEIARLCAKIEEQAAIIHGMQDGALVRDQGALIDILRSEKKALSKRTIDATFWANQTGDKLADARAELDKYKLAHNYWKSACSCGAVDSEICTPTGMPSGVQREGRGGGLGPLIHCGEGDPPVTTDSIRPDRQDATETKGEPT